MSQAKTFSYLKRDSTTLDQTGRHWSPAPLIVSVYTQFSFSVISWFWNKITNINSAVTECGNYLKWCKTKQQQQQQQQITDSLSPNTGAPWVNIPSKPGPLLLYGILFRFHESSADAARYTRYCIWAADGAVRLLRPQIVKVTERLTSRLSLTSCCAMDATAPTAHPDVDMMPVQDVWNGNYIFCLNSHLS